MQDNGISWRVYQNELSIQSDLKGDDDSWLANFTDNNLEWFTQYHVRFHKAHIDFLQKRTNELPAEIKELQSELKKASKNKAKKLEKLLHQKQKQVEKYKKELITWSPENFNKLSEYEKELHRNAFVTNTGDPNYHSTEMFSYEDEGQARNILIPKGDILHQFRQDVQSGKLPTVSWLVAPQYFSDHPSAPWFGAWYVSEVLDILTQNPEVWKKTIFILNYDENDGYFDHIPPFVAPKPGDTQSGKVSNGMDTSSDYVTLKEELSKPDMEKEYAREGPVGLGFRVPLVIASPWSRGGWVNSQVFDHTSTLQFLEKFLSKKTGKEIKESNISDWRRAISGNLTSVFRPYNGEKINLPEFVKHDPFIKEIYNAKFKNLPVDYKVLSGEEVSVIRKNPFDSPLLPRQEKGIRDSCALPYQLYAEGELSSDKKFFRINFSAEDKVFKDESAGSPFSVYIPGKFAVTDSNNMRVFGDANPSSYAVRAGDRIDAQWALNDFENETYHLIVHGPNGFFREFSGDKNDPAVNIRLEYEGVNDARQKLSGDIILLFNNPENEKYTIELIDNNYKTEKKSFVLNENESKGITINTGKNYHWYDVSIKISGNKVFEKRYAGRVETGNHTKSDPLMGKVIV